MISRAEEKVVDFVLTRMNDNAETVSARAKIEHNLAIALAVGFGFATLFVGTAFGILVGYAIHH